MDLQRFAEGRTEAPTQKRQQEARERGQTFHSVEVSTAATLLAGYLVLRGTGPGLWQRLLDFTVDSFHLSPAALTSPSAATAVLTRMAFTVALAVAPLLLTVAIVGAAMGVVQSGFVFSLRPLAPDFGRLSPAQGLQRLFSRRSLVEGLKAVAKLALVAWVAYGSLRSQQESLLALGGQPVGTLAATIAGVAGSVMLRVALALVAIAALDFWFQRSEFFGSLKMTKQEVKEEIRQTEGSPEVRQRVRRRQREIIRKRMLQDVKKASVVVTNPTHFAVALLYLPGMPAPKLVAKGQGYLALRIRELAAVYTVPLVENPPLARSLYTTVELGAQIPMELYAAVAEVLAFVYRLRGTIPGRA